MRLALSAWCSIRHFTQDTIIIFPRPSETRFSFEGKEDFERRFHSNVYDSYPGPGHQRQFGEQSAATKYFSWHGNYQSHHQRSKLQPKGSARKKKAKYDTWFQSRIMIPPNAGKTQTKDGFKSELYIKRGLRLLRLKADSSRKKWLIMYQK